MRTAVVFQHGLHEIRIVEHLVLQSSHEVVNVDELRLGCARVRLTQLLQPGKLLRSPGNGQSELSDLIQLAPRSRETSDRQLYPYCLRHAFKRIPIQVGWIDLVYQNLVIACNLIFHTTQCLMDACSEVQVVFFVNLQQLRSEREVVAF